MPGYLRCAVCEKPVHKAESDKRYPYTAWRHVSAIDDERCSWGYPRPAGVRLRRR